MNIGAFFSISGMTKNRILLPRTYACSSRFTRPSLPVCVIPESWQFQLSSLSKSVPRYVSPVLSSICARWERGSRRKEVSAPNRRFEMETPLGSNRSRDTALGFRGNSRAKTTGIARCRVRATRSSRVGAARTYRDDVSLGFVKKLDGNADALARSGRHHARSRRTRRWRFARAKKKGARCSNAREGRRDGTRELRRGGEHAGSTSHERARARMFRPTR